MMPSGLIDIGILAPEYSRRMLEVLYDMLAERDPISNISHRAMPTFEEHKAFVRNYLWNREEGYLRWFLITPPDPRNLDVVYGQLYLTRRLEIGIQIAKAHQGNGYATMAMNEVLKMHSGKRLLANIAPGNLASQKFFAKFGFKLIQHTYSRDG
jgi:RimJ/RimL family protein N-acetyltransferase